METLEILWTITWVLAGLAIIGLVTGGSKRRYRREEFERRQDRLDADFKTMHMFNSGVARDRDRLLKERYDYLSGVAYENHRMEKLRGQAWEDINKAMVAYDTKHMQEWYDAGMVPPSFANNVNYYSDMSKCFNLRKQIAGIIS